MVTAAILATLRRLLNEVDQEASDLTDPELLAAIEDVRMELQVRGIGTFADYTVGVEQDGPGFGVSPEPSDIDGVLLAYGAAVGLLGNEYRGRLNRGELGMSWSSGFEAESSISAAQAYQRLLGQLDRRYQELLIIRRASTSGFRAQ